MQTVVWIAWVGGLLLFTAFAGLVGLMYLMTSPLLQGRRARPDPGQPAHEPVAQAVEVDQHEARRRAAAIGVAVARAEADGAVYMATDAPLDWRRLHRSLRLRQRIVRREPR